MSFHRRRQDAGNVSVKHLPKGPNGRALCRYCNVEVPAGRRTFCSDLHVHKWKIQTNPGYVRDCLRKRDRGVCALCGVDTYRIKWIYTVVVRFEHDVNLSLTVFSRRLARDHAASDWLLETWGITNHRISWWAADHIVPVSEGGGECGLENYRTICQSCHKGATAELRKRLAGKSQERLQPTLFGRVVSEATDGNVLSQQGG